MLSSGAAGLERAPHSPSTVLITGAAGNLGSRLARHLLGSGHLLRLMVHRTPLPDDLAAAANVEAVRSDLGRPETLPGAVRGAQVVIHFAGRLFAPRPERFLAETNTGWFSNLTDAALEAGVERILLISFPHVEGPTTPEEPASGRTDRNPVSVHARTRLAEEKLLLKRTSTSKTTPVILRLGMVYGRGILMIEAARWLAKRRLLAVWRRPTWFHLLSTPDFLRATEAAAFKAGIEGIYHVGDDSPVTIQEFLDRACAIWYAPRPWRVPVWTIMASAELCELFALVFGTRAPLTKDFIRLGQVSHCGDTTRMRNELLSSLTHPTLQSGLPTLR